MGRHTRTSSLIDIRFAFLGLIALGALVVGCSSTPPPIAPWPPDVDPAPAPVAIATDPSALRPTVEHQRERLRELIDLAERRELREGGPPMLKTAKEQSRVLDRLEARIDEAIRSGAGDSEIDAIGDELRRFSARLDLLAEAISSDAAVARSR